AELHSLGEPVLWRNGKTIQLADNYGAAYAISEGGLIVGTLAMDSRPRAYLTGFVARSRDAKPRVSVLDDLVNIGRGQHVQAAFGVSDDGRILVIVTDSSQEKSLVVLIPVRPAGQ